MNNFEKSVRRLRSTGIILISICLLFIAGCKEDEKPQKNPDEGNYDEFTPPEAIQQDPQSPESIISIDKLGAKKAEDFAAFDESSARVAGPTTYIHFGDEDACIYVPSICSSTFVTWPGYIQSTGYGEWGYAWMSNGPGTNFISYGTGDHYHISGFAFPEVEPNHKHTAMFGDDWFAFYMQRSGRGRINFDLTEIKVKGDVPITLYFKAADGSWWYWPSIGPGWWSLPGARNIQELHIRAASRNPGDKYSIDDIQVKGL